MDVEVARRVDSECEAVPRQRRVQSDEPLNQHRIECKPARRAPCAGASTNDVCTPTTTTVGAIPVATQRRSPITRRATRSSTSLRRRRIRLARTAIITAIRGRHRMSTRGRCRTPIILRGRPRPSTKSRAVVMSITRPADRSTTPHTIRVRIRLGDPHRMAVPPHPATSSHIRTVERLAAPVIITIRIMLLRQRSRS